MIPKTERETRIERKITLSIAVIFLGLIVFALLFLLRSAGFEWQRDSYRPIVGRDVASNPYFGVRVPLTAPPEALPHPGPSVVADVPSALPRNLSKPPNVRAIVQSYMETLQQTETNKRTLLHALLQLSPDLQQFMQRKTLGRAEDADLDRSAISRNNLSDQQVAGLPLRALPTDEWDRLISSFTKKDPPAACLDLHEAYIAHLKALRDVTMKRYAGSHPSLPPAPQDAKDQDQAYEELLTRTRLADENLVSLCGQYGLPVSFEVRIDDK